MPNKLITDLPLASAVGTSVAPVSDSAGTTTSKVTLASIAALGGGAPGDGTVTTAKLANSAVTYAKLQNVSATDRLLGRSTAGAGVLEEIVCTAYGRSVLAAVDAVAARTTLGAAPTASPTFTGAVTVPLGSILAPGVATTGAANTGLYFPSSGLGFSSGGVRQFNVASTGELGVGSSAATAGIRLRADYRLINSNSTGLYCTNVLDSTASATYSGYAGQMHQFYDVAAGTVNGGSGRALSLTSLRNYSTTTDAGSLTTLRGLEVSFGHHNTAALTPTTTNVIGLLLQPFRGPGTVDSMYDLYIASDAIGTGTITNHWAIYQNNPALSSFFAGKIGIGVVSPASALHINGPLTLPLGSVTAPSITLSGDTNTGIYFPGADTVAVTTGGVERLRVDSTGRTTIANLAATNLAITAVSGAVPASIAEGRLTFVSNDPVPYTSDVRTGYTTLYYTPATGNKIMLYDAASATWRMQTFSNISLSLAGTTADTNYDVFVYSNAGTLTLALSPWTGETRPVLFRRDGVMVLNSNNGYRYVGTLRTTTAGVSEDNQTRRFLWNMDNKIQRLMFFGDNVQHTYSGTSGTYRPWRNLQTLGQTRVEFVTGEFGNGSMVNIPIRMHGWTAAIGAVALDSTTGVAGGPYVANTVNDTALAIGGVKNLSILAGYHYLQALQGGFTSLTGVYVYIESSPTILG